MMGEYVGDDAQKKSAASEQHRRLPMSKSKKVGIGVMVFYVLLGFAWFVREIAVGAIDSAFWQIFIGSFAAVYGVFAGTDSWQRQTKSKYYRAEMDDEHPQAQKAAIEARKARTGREWRY